MDTRGRDVAGFYHGLTTNLVRVFPGRVTFVVYANIDWLFKRAVSSAFIEEGLMARLTHVLLY